MAMSESKGKCPICDRTSDAKYRPFCSKRCADVDLARWLSGSYAIPDDEDEDGGDTTLIPQVEDIPQRKI